MSEIEQLKKKINLDDIEYALLHYFIYCGETHAERAELAAKEYAALRADLSAAQAESSGRLDSLNNWYSLWEYIIKQLGGDSDLLPSESSFDAMMSRVVTLQPRRCTPDGRKCFVAGFDAAREAALQACAYEAWHGSGNDRRYKSVTETAAIISALTPPDACDGCNPLEPSSDDVTDTCPYCGVSGGKHHFDCDLI